MMCRNFWMEFSECDMENVTTQSRRYSFDGAAVSALLTRVGNWSAMLFICGLLVLGWLQRDDAYFEAEMGVGYALGIIGGSMMLALLIYPLRKRVKSMGRMLSVKFWFRLHMTFGVLGPVAIMFHSNFSLGSTNSNVALVCMLLVASSGLVGRYLYVWIHHGLYGSRVELSEFKAPTEDKRQVLAKYLPNGDEIVAKVEQLQKLALTPANGYWHSIKLRKMSRREGRALASMVRRALKQASKSEQRLNKNAMRLVWSNLSEYVTSVKKTADFRVHEQMFALWHVFHLPLFVMMIISGIVHVVVVHMY